MSSVPYGSSQVNDSGSYYSPLNMDPPSSFENFSPFLRNEDTVGPPGLQYQQNSQLGPLTSSVSAQSFPPGLIPNSMGASPMMYSSQSDPTG